jgi:hypothetical protein
MFEWNVMCLKMLGKCLTCLAERGGGQVLQLSKSDHNFFQKLNFLTNRSCVKVRRQVNTNLFP